MIPLGDETPEGWIVTGYPWEQIDTPPSHKAFVDAYRAKFNDTPRLGSLLGFVVVEMIANLLNKTPGLETDALINALSGLETDTIAGKVTMRGLDHQSTLGAWVGETALQNGRGVLRNWRFADGKDYMFSEAEVLAARPR